MNNDIKFLTLVTNIDYALGTESWNYKPNLNCPTYKTKTISIVYLLDSLKMCDV